MTRIQTITQKTGNFIGTLGSALLIITPPIFFVVFSIILACHAENTDVKIQAGYLDLTEWAQNPTIVRLRGEYEFLGPQGITYRQVPDQWTDEEAGAQNGFGYGIYRFRLRLPTYRRWGLKILTAATSWRLKIFGKEVARAGNPHPDPAKAVPEYKPAIVLLPESELLDIEIEVSNWEYRVGGLWRAPEVGPYGLLRQSQNTKDHLYIGLALTLSSLAILCLVGFGYFPEFFSLLYFSILCLIFGLRALVTGDYLIVQFFSGMSFDFIIRLEYLTIYIAVPAIILFITEILKNLPKRLWLRRAALLYIPLLAALPFLPLPILTRTLAAVGLINLILSLTMVFYPLVLLSQKSSFTILTIFSGGLTLFLTLINDFLHNNFIIQSTNLLPWGQYVYCLMLGLVILRETAQKHRENRVLSDNLKKTNQSLLKEIEYNESAKLEVYHQVRNSLQIINSIINLDHAKLSNPKTNIQALKSLQLRISALGLVQEKILESILIDEIALVPYFSEILSLIRRNLFTNDVQVELRDSGPPILLPKSQCRDLSMILIEFIIYLFENLSEIQSIEVQVINTNNGRFECTFELKGKIHYGDEGTCEGINITIIESYCIKNNFRYELNCGEELTSLKVMN